MKKLLFAALAALVLMAGCSKSDEPEATPTPEATPEVTATPEATPETTPETVVYTDGTYEGAAKGHNGGDLKVSVVVTDGKIASIEVLEHTETEGISDPAIKDIPAAIVAANSTDVDTIADATVTSQAIIDAVNNALEAAVAK